MGMPPSVRAALKSMDKDQQRAFRREYNRQAKSVIVCYVTWLLLGWHYLYLGRAGMQFAFWFTAGGLLLWWLLDLLRVPAMVGAHNADLARTLMSQHKMMAS